MNDSNVLAGRTKYFVICIYIQGGTGRSVVAAGGQTLTICHPGARRTNGVAGRILGQETSQCLIKQCPGFESGTSPMHVSEAPLSNAAPSRRARQNFSNSSEPISKHTALRSKPADPLHSSPNLAGGRSPNRFGAWPTLVLAHESQPL
jgi:hypothetical protein